MGYNSIMKTMKILSTRFVNKVEILDETSIISPLKYFRYPFVNLQ